MLAARTKEWSLFTHPGLIPRQHSTFFFSRGKFTWCLEVTPKSCECWGNDALGESVPMRVLWKSNLQGRRWFRGVSPSPGVSSERSKEGLRWCLLPQDRLNPGVFEEMDKLFEKIFTDVLPLAWEPSCLIYMTWFPERRNEKNMFVFK